MRISERVYGRCYEASMNKYERCSHHSSSSDRSINRSTGEEEILQELFFSLTFASVSMNICEQSHSRSFVRHGWQGEQLFGSMIDTWAKVLLSCLIDHFLRQHFSTDFQSNSNWTWTSHIRGKRERERNCFMLIFIKQGHYLRDILWTDDRKEKHCFDSSSARLIVCVRTSSL